MTIEFKWNDIDNLREIMNKYGDIDYTILGENQDGEDQKISIGQENIIVNTFQNNGWVRRNVFWYDGAVEETYIKKWK